MAPFRPASTDAHCDHRRLVRRQAAGRGCAGEAIGPWVQVSRLGNPLINEVIIPMGKKDYWNITEPMDDAQFLRMCHP